MRVRFFWQLLDVFKSYTGLGGKFLRVRQDEKGIEAVEVQSIGDMTKSVYDKNNDGIVDNSEITRQSDNKIFLWKLSNDNIPYLEEVK